MIVNYSNLGYAIHEIRQIKDMTQKEISEICGVSISCISKLEKGLYDNITIDSLNSIFDALGMSLELHIIDKKVKNYVEHK